LETAALAEIIGTSRSEDFDEIYGWPCSCGGNVVGLLAPVGSDAVELYECLGCGLVVTLEDLEPLEALE